MRDRDRAFRRFKRTRDNAHRDYYKALRNYVTFAVRAVKKAYMNAQLNQANSQSMWRRYNYLLATKKMSPQLPSTIADANKINEYFINSVPVLPVDDTLLDYFKNNYKCQFGELLEFRTVSVEEITTLIYNIKSEAVGLDNISVRFLRYCLPYIVRYIGILSILAYWTTHFHNNGSRL